MLFFQPLLAVLAAAHLVHGHSHLSSFVINGDAYRGYDPRGTNKDVLPSWYTEVEKDGWVGMKDYASPDIVCHLNADHPLGYASVAAGDSISWYWVGWPESHKGPVSTYMAYCGDDGTSCAQKNKTDLEFFKIGGAALLDPTRKAFEFSVAQGYWATDLLISRNNTWLVEIPETLKPGFYVARHELIALHYALDPDMGPQHYPQCITLEVTGTGSVQPKGVAGTELYRIEDPGLLYDIFREELEEYTIPGPALISGAEEMAQTQTSSKVTRWAEATPLARG